MTMGFTSKGLSDLRPLFQAPSARSFQDDSGRDGACVAYGELTSSQSALEALEKPGRFNFDFAWDDPCLSDRVLLLHITDEPVKEATENSFEACEVAEGNVLTDGTCEASVEVCEALAVAAESSGNGRSNQQGEGVVTSVGSKGDEQVFTPPASSSAKPRKISLNVASLVLAEKSPFFRSMWQKAGMRESLSKSPTVLNISAEEEAPVLELLRLIYTGQSKPFSTQPRDIVNLLKAADKFLVSSCVRICIEALKHFPYTLDTSLLYLGLPEALQQKLELRHLIAGARTFITEEFKDLEVVKQREEFLTLPFHVIEMLLQGDGLATVSEDLVFEAALAWVRCNFECPEEREKSLESLAEHIRFPFISGDYLLDYVAGTTEMCGEAGQNYVVEALRFKAYSPERQLRAVMGMKGHRRFLRRPGTESMTCFYWDVHGHGMEVALKHCSLQGILCESQRFCVNGRWFKLQFRKTKVGDTCGLYLSMDHSLQCSAKGSVDVHYRFYVKRWPSGEYILLHPSSKVSFSDGDTTAWGYEEPWLPFSSCPHVNSDGYMSIRADLFLTRATT